MVSSVFVAKIDKKTQDNKGIDNVEFVWVCRLCEHKYDFDFPPALDTLMQHDVNLLLQQKQEFRLPKTIHISHINGAGKAGLHVAPKTL